MRGFVIGRCSARCSKGDHRCCEVPLKVAPALRLPWKVAVGSGPPCDSGRTRHEGRSQIGAHRQCEKEKLGVSVSHQRQHGAPCEVVLLLRRWSRAPRWLSVAAEVLGRRGRVRSRGRLVPFARPAVAVARLDGHQAASWLPGEPRCRCAGARARSRPRRGLRVETALGLGGKAEARARTEA